MTTATIEPSWLKTLRAECAKTSLRRVGLRIGYSHATVSQVLNGKYPGDLAAVEAEVVAAFPEQSEQLRPDPDDSPAWLVTLRAKCSTLSQRGVAERLGVSVTVVNQVLKGKYPGNLKRIEALVRGKYLDEKVSCPVAGSIPMSSCASQQDRPWGSCNHPELKYLYKRCRAGCPNSWHPVNVAYAEELREEQARRGGGA